MAVALEFRISDLIAEFLAHTSVFLRALQPAGAVALLLLQPFTDAGDDLLVFIEPDLHAVHAPFFIFLIMPRNLSVNAILAYFSAHVKHYHEMFTIRAQMF